jgi:hypothetical protein
VERVEAREIARLLVSIHTCRGGFLKIKNICIHTFIYTHEWYQEV